MRGRVLLVGTDMGARGDDAIVEGLKQLAAESAECLHVVHVIEPGQAHVIPGAPELTSEERALADCPSALRRRVQYDAVLNGVPYVSAQVYTHVRLGRPVPTLLQDCVDFEADLLIVGAHGRKGLQHLLIGSVAEQLLRRARCPVLIARPKNYHGLSKSRLGPEQTDAAVAWQSGARSP